MSSKDRLRAKKPVTNPEKWNKGTVIDTDPEGKVTIKDGKEIEIDVTPEIMRLFESRIDGEVEGAEAWYIKK